VHRVTEFMGQRAHVIILAVIVEEHVGVNVIGPPWEYAPDRFPSAG